MSYDIEMLWECSICNHRDNRGIADRYCSQCGHKKDDSDPEYMPDDLSEAAALTGDAARKAAAGEDWVCQYCDSLQNQLNRCCSNCGATERGTKQRIAPAIAPVLMDPVTHRPVEAEVHSEPPPKLSWYRFWLHRFVVRLAVTMAIVSIGWFGWWLFAPHEVNAHVSALSWEHDVLIDRYQVWHREGWYADGGSFEVQPLGSRLHHYDRVHVGSHQESYRDRYSCGETCTTSPSYTTCSSNGNGTARCTKHGGDRSCSTKYCYRTAYHTVEDYESVPRYQMWFGWKVWDWGYSRTVSRSGHSRETFWPNDSELRAAYLNPGEQERSSRHATYEVTFEDTDGDAYKIAPRSHEEFMRYGVGDSHKLKVVRAGSVEVLP